MNRLTKYTLSWKWNYGKESCKMQKIDVGVYLWKLGVLHNDGALSISLEKFRKREPGKE